MQGTKIADSTSERFSYVPFKIISVTNGETHVVVTDSNGFFSTKDRRSAGDLDEELGTDLSGFLGIDSLKKDSDDNADGGSTSPDESTPGNSFPEEQSPDVTNLTFVTREVFHAAG